MSDVDNLLKGYKIFGILGYKPKDLGGFDENNAINKWVKFSLKAMVAHLCNRHNKIAFLCGGLPGTEIWGAEEVLSIRGRKADLDCKVVMVMPFENLSGRNAQGLCISPKPWPIDSHNRLMSILQAVDHIETLSNGDYAAWRIKMRDEWVITHSDGLLVVAKSEQGTSPIGNVLSQARHEKKPVCVIDPFCERIYAD